ncbi:hypothetical protein [Dapis sp. BLCC M229]|uniref:hypothetical protein n=1 Tax=Dapis sp. BLCC M229 TaxID=3400188 RepID=UPI003CF4ACCB
MVNKLKEGDNLIPVDNSNLLQQILNKLLEKILFKISSDVATARLRQRLDFQWEYHV